MIADLTSKAAAENAPEVLEMLAWHEGPGVLA